MLADVIAQFRASSLTLEAKAFMADIASGEATAFNELAGGGTFDSYATFPQWSGFAHVWNGKTVISHGAGLFQDETETWETIAKNTGLPDFSPQSQISGNWWWACLCYERNGIIGGAKARDLQADLTAGAIDHAPLANQWGRGAVAGPPGQRYAQMLALMS